MGSDSINDAAAPVSHEQRSCPIDDEREGVIEAFSEVGDPLRSPARSEPDPHYPPAVTVPQVLAPEGDEEVAAPKRGSVRGRVRLEVGGRRSDAAAAARELPQAIARPQRGHP